MGFFGPLDSLTTGIFDNRTFKMYRTLDEAYDEVNWKRIHAYMTLVGWKWDGEVPADIHELQVTVSNLMHEINRSKRDNTSSSTGGFSINKWTFDSGVYYEITFDIS